MSAFDPDRLVPAALFAEITELRVTNAGRIAERLAARPRRPTLTTDGKLNIVAVDHPARGVRGLGADPTGMLDRRRLLARVARALQADSVDGLLATIDVIEDLVLLDDLLGGAGLLANRVLVASLNRGGVAGSAWELDDRMTGPTPAECVGHGLDAAKLLLRFAPDERDTLATLVASAQAVSACADAGLNLFVEPLPVHRVGARWALNAEADSIAALVNIAQGLGSTSRHLWLKLPYCADFARVAAASSLPIVLLGGPAESSIEPLLADLRGAMGTFANVRGAMLGRHVLAAADPLAAAEAAGAVVHGR